MDLFDDLSPATGRLDDHQAFDLLRELERNTSEEIRLQRSHFRFEIQARVILQPANASARLKLKMQGTTGDLSEGGCRILFPLPVHVGDVYRLDFSESDLRLPLIFARCVRCMLLREDAFEAGFSFFAPIAMPENLRRTARADNAARC